MGIMMLSFQPGGIKLDSLICENTLAGRGAHTHQSGKVLYISEDNISSRRDLPEVSEAISPLTSDSDTGVQSGKPI